MSSVPHSFYKLELWLEVDGEEVPVDAVRVDFELNSIPRASCLLPVGRDGYTGEASPVHAMAALDELTDARLMCEVAAHFGDDGLGLPGGAFTLFEGFTAGAGYSRQASPPSAGYSLNLQHWLGNLNFSSIFSSYSHPSNPSQYSAAAILPADGTGEGGKPISDGLFDYADNIKADKIAAELFESALLPYFKELARQEGLQVSEVGFDAEPLDNSAAAEALGRLKSGGKLRLSDAGAELAGMLEEDLGTVLRDRDELAGHTFWDVLAGACAPLYLFALCPRIDDCLIVPYVPSLKGPYKEIGADQYYGAQLTGVATRPLQAVGIVGGIAYGTNADGRAESDPAIRGLGVGGWFKHPTRKKGMVTILSAPRWASKLFAASEYAADAAGAFGKLKGVANRPNAAGAPNPQIRAAKGKAAESSKGFLDRYAKYIYAIEESKQRQGVVTGPFRLDIAPGSTVKVEAVGEQFLGGEDRTAESFLGSVLRVSHSIDCRSRQASTSFHLAYLRTESQNEQEGRALESHPIYAETWAGAGLRDDEGGDEEE